jgi:hypothetical protein
MSDGPASEYTGELVGEPPVSFLQGGLDRARLPKGRCGVISRLYYHPSGTKARSVETRWGWWCHSKEGLYERDVDVGSEWSPIDLGWFIDDPTEVAMLVLVSKEKPPRGEHPMKVIEAALLVKAQIQEPVPPPAYPARPRTMWDSIKGPPPPSAPPPTQEQVIVVPFASIAPGAPFQGNVPSLASVVLRCEQGPAVCKIALFPK